MLTNTIDRRFTTLLLVALLAVASLAAADVASLNLTAGGPANVAVSGAADLGTVELGAGDTVELSLPTAGLYLVEQLASTMVPSCDGAITETSAVVLDETGVTPLGGAATIDLAAGESAHCAVGG